MNPFRSTLEEKDKVVIQRIVRQQSQKEIAADNLAHKLLEIEKLEKEKTKFMADYKSRKDGLELEIRNISAIIRNYTPLFETVNTDSGEIKDGVK